MEKNDGFLKYLIYGVEVPRVMKCMDSRIVAFFPGAAYVINPKVTRLPARNGEVRTGTGTGTGIGTDMR